MGLVALRHVGYSQTRDRTHVPCIGRQIPNHCTTREVHRDNIYYELFQRAEFGKTCGVTKSITSQHNKTPLIKQHLVTDQVTERGRKFLVTDKLSIGSYLKRKKETIYSLQFTWTSKVHSSDSPVL